MYLSWWVFWFFMFSIRRSSWLKVNMNLLTVLYFCMHYFGSYMYDYNHTHLVSLSFLVRYHMLFQRDLLPKSSINTAYEVRITRLKFNEQDEWRMVILFIESPMTKNYVDILKIEVLQKNNDTSYCIAVHFGTDRRIEWVI